MKRLFSFMALLSLFLVTWAQNPLVTLSHNGKLSFFSTPYPLEAAINAASNGDILYLSDGMFTSSSSELIIGKRLSIIGTGYNSEILPDIVIQMSDNSYGDTNSDRPLFEGVKLNKLRFQSDKKSRANLWKVIIRASMIKTLSYGGYAGKKFYLDKCYIENAGQFLGAASNETTLTNCKIRTIADGESYAITVINCNIGKLHYCPRMVVSSVLGDGPVISTASSDNVATSFYTYGTHTIINSFVNKKNVLGVSDIHLSNCYLEEWDGHNSNLFSTNLDCVLDLDAKGYFGVDGTVVGVGGGLYPFSETPFVPTVDSENSSVEYDSESNQLKVTIKVKPN